ncbi:MAG: peptidoglycan-binding protein [Burkholderiaceae bacterium]|nr:peptidoglycan-binding protein [Burkholderiaceae bacterium]
MPFDHSSSPLLVATLAIALGFGSWAGQAHGAQPGLGSAFTHPTPPADESAPGMRASSDPSASELHFRMRSPRVRELQARLRQAKYLAVDNVDDRFGMLTRKAVLDLQRDSGLPATGAVDPATWNALLQRSRAPTEAELNNLDIGPWFTAPTQPGYLRELQHRLRQVGLYGGPVDGAFDDATRRAIEVWRLRLGLVASDVMDERAWMPLVGRTRNPRYADLFDAPPASALAQELDARCAVGKVVCISRQQRLMSFVVDGEVKFTREARFARPGWESPGGEFRIWYKNSDTISKIFGERTPMPYAIFYQGNVAIHFSQDFADKGYESGSHGCSQLRDYQVAKWLYEQVKIGDRVVVY